MDFCFLKNLFNVLFNMVAALVVLVVLVVLVEAATKGEVILLLELVEAATKGESTPLLELVEGLVVEAYQSLKQTILSA